MILLAAAAPVKQTVVIIIILLIYNKCFSRFQTLTNVRLEPTIVIQTPTAQTQRGRMSADVAAAISATGGLAEVRTALGLHANADFSFLLFIVILFIYLFSVFFLVWGVMLVNTISVGSSIFKRCRTVTNNEC